MASRGFRPLALLNPSRARAGAVISGSIAAFVLVLGSPVLLVHLWGLPWGRVAEIGDAYGGASALVSAVALCGVGASLIYQQRQLRQEMLMFRRQQHFDLVRLGIDDTELLRAVDIDLGSSPDGRQQAYLNLMTNDEELLLLASSIFRGEVGRRWWTRYGKNWIGTRQRPSHRRFVGLMPEAHAAEVAAAGPAGSG